MAIRKVKPFDLDKLAGTLTAISRDNGPRPDLRAPAHRDAWRALLADSADEDELDRQLGRLGRLTRDQVVGVYVLLRNARLWAATHRRLRRVGADDPWFRRREGVLGRATGLLAALGHLYEALARRPELRMVLGIEAVPLARSYTRTCARLEAALRADRALRSMRPLTLATRGRTPRRRGHQPEPYKARAWTGLRQLGIGREAATVWLRLIGLKPPEAILSK